MKRLLAGLLLISTSAFAGTWDSSYAAPSLTPPPVIAQSSSQVCLVNVGTAMADGNKFTMVKADWDEHEPRSLRATLEFGRAWVVIKFATVEQYQAWVANFVSLLRNQCGAK